jgi:hypothetical protein
VTERRDSGQIDDVEDRNGIDVVDGIDVADLCFTARALAQAHPMSEPALRYRQSCFETERERQHISEIADWASTALLVGYCVRRSEERAAEVAVVPRHVEADTLASGATELGITLRTGDAGSVTLLSGPATVAAIDRIIGTEIHKRHEHLHDQLDDEAWAELKAYVAWWVVHGYCVRVVETS